MYKCPKCGTDIIDETNDSDKKDKVYFCHVCKNYWEINPNPENLPWISKLSLKESEEVKEYRKNSMKGKTIKPTSWTIKLDCLSRNCPETVVCEHCGNEAEQTNCIRSERKEIGCGRSYDCCSVAYKCTYCGLRMVSSLPAPDFE